MLITEQIFVSSKPSSMSLAPRTPQAKNEPVLDKRLEVQEAGLASTSTHPVTVLTEKEALLPVQEDYREVQAKEPVRY